MPGGSNSVSCPYLPQGTPRGICCTGKEHLIAGSEKRTRCPLVCEAEQWASHFGVRGSAPYLFSTFRNDYQPDAYNAALQWSEDPKGILVLASQPGRGKSRLALSAWYAIRRRCQPCYLMGSTQFLHLAILDSKGQDEDGVMHRLVGENLMLVTHDSFADPVSLARKNVPVVFDDLGTERTSDTFRDYFRQLLAYRENLLITTNHDERTLATILGDRIQSRMSVASWVWLDGEDRRVEFDVVGGIHG